MSWTEEQIKKFQMDNTLALELVNKTLQPDSDLSDECVGIFAFGQNGDSSVCTGVLKYRREIFGNKKIIWFINFPNCDQLKYAPISEVRPYPWAGNGLPEGTQNFWPMLTDEDNHLKVEDAKNWELTKDLSAGFFPCPFMVVSEKRSGVEYSNVSKKVFGVPMEYEWHPFLSFSELEIAQVDEFVHDLPKRKTICIESFAGSGQSTLNDFQVRRAIKICRDMLEGCNIVLVSHKYLRDNEIFPDDLLREEGIYTAAHFSVRQCALLVGRSDLLISVSSGIAVSASCWNNNPTPIIQYTGSLQCSTAAIALGKFELITTGDKSPQAAADEFDAKLVEILNYIK